MKEEKKTVLRVVKIGGKLLEDELKLHTFLKSFSCLEGPKILVHGGGVFATELAGRLGIPVQMLDGRRITDKATMELINLTYSGLNKNLVAKLQNTDCNAIGLCGADGRAVISKRREVEEIDYGYVGDIVNINRSFIQLLLQQEFIPVFSALTCTEKGVLLNTNADSIATEIAKAMSENIETELYFCLEKKGVLRDLSNEDSVIEELNTQLYREMKATGAVTDGMLPKLDNCFQALEGGISAIYLGNENLLRAQASSTKIVK